MVERLAPVARRITCVALVLLTAEIAAVSVARYFTDLSPPPEPVAANAFADPFLRIHVIGGVLALVVGPLQLVRGIRARWPAMHRASGRVFVLAAAIGAPSGLVLAVGTTAGPVAATGFAIPALLWPALTWSGVRAVLDRRFDEHREWMLRSYAIVANAITLRLMLPASMLMGIGFFTAYPVIAWLGWITNLAAAEYYIRRTRRSPRGIRVLAAA